MARRLALRLASALILGLSSFVQAQNPALLLQHVNIIDTTGAASHGAVDVLIRNHRIEKIASHVSPPHRARVVSAAGEFLIPGLWDMHVHVWDADLAFPLFLANGVTGIRNMGGHPEDLKRWQKELSDEKRVGPRLIACGPVVDGPPPIHADHSVMIETAGDARASVDKLQSDGWDFNKVYDNVPRPAYFALAEEAKKKQLPFVGHVPLSITALEASDAGQKSIEHLDGLDYVISPRGDGFRQARVERIGNPPEPGAMMK